MALRDEQADILGGPILQRPDSGVFAAFSQYHVVFKSVTLLGLALLVWIACARGFEHLKKSRELRCRKAMRRKHGIPDSDCRPFAVAYAAAKRTHLEREAQDRKKTINDVSYHNPPVVDQRTNAQKDACLRRRVPETTVQHHNHHHPINYAAVNDKMPPEVPPLDLPDRYNPNPRRRAALPVDSPHVPRTIRRDLVLNLDDNEESRKRCFEDESDVEHETIKKSRIDGDELIDKDEQADWYAQYSDKLFLRARKEFLGRQPQRNGQEIFKHVHNLRNEGHEHDEAMEGIDEDEVMELGAVLRGKKRDRAEAGSTFGGDDDEDIRNGRALHHRKRRTILQRIEVPPRGQKRDRETESPESEGEGVDSEIPRRRAQRSPKKKRGKKDKSEISIEDPCISKDPLCGGRRVGEGWEADGVQYKVGEKGERLRLTLVKKARNKYHMPQDSQHPDRSAALDIYVETWLTEGQYRRAEGKQELVWQETSRESSVSKTPDVPDSPTKNGKNLLWDSVKCSPARRPFRQSTLPGTLIRVNPFEQWQPQPVSGRRVASSSTFASPILPGVADSPTRPGFRAFSKWEKQDREADAMARIRAKIEEEKKALAPPRKSAEIPASVTASELGTRLPAVPIITLTPAPTVAAEGKSDDGSAQSRTNTPGSSLSSASTAIPSTLFPNLPTAPTAATSTSSLSPFSLVKPPQVPSSTSAVAPSSATPNIFGKEVGESTPTSSAFSSSTLGATTEPKPIPISFTKPEVPSSILSHAAPTSKPPASTVGAVPKSFPSPLSYASGAAATKVEIPVPPPISALATATDSSKPAPPLFSFPASSTSSTTAATATPSAPSMPKFSFGQPTTASIITSSPNQVPTSQAKPTFKFNQTQPNASGASAVAAANESKRSDMPASALGTAASSIEPIRPPSFGASFAFGNPSHAPQPASATNLFGKPVAVDSDSLTSMSPKPTLAFAPASATPFDNTTPAILAAPTSGSTPIFSLSGTNSGSEGFKPTTMYGGSNPVSLFGGNLTEGKPAFTFGTPADGLQPKSPSIFGSSLESSQPVFAFGHTAETPKVTPVPGGAVGTPKATFPISTAVDAKATSGPATESSKPTNTTDPLKPTPFTGNTAFAPLSAKSAFAFGKKDDAAFNASTFVGTQAKPTASFAFAPSGTSGPIFGQSSSFATSGDSVFGKSTGTTPNAFGFSGTGGSSSSSAFTFSKPTTQNQKQEQ